MSKKLHLFAAAVCFTGDFTDSNEEKYVLNYYVEIAKELEKMGAHILAIKDMAGLCHHFLQINLLRL